MPPWRRGIKKPFYDYYMNLAGIDPEDHPFAFASSEKKPLYIMANKIKVSYKPVKGWAAASTFLWNRTFFELF